MNNLHEVVQTCLEEIEQGATIDTVLFRYPDLADELRPILEASVYARNMGIPAPSPEVVRRNRARVLQQAAQIRERRHSSRRVLYVSLRRLIVTLAVVITLFVSGTSLVGAASTTLPGDQLYPVKRTWEDVLVLFTFNLQQRETLEVEHENERLHELRELFAEGRAAEVEFAGIITSQTGNEWMVSGITVVLSSQTEIDGEPITVGSAIRVQGRTQQNNAVMAEQIELLPAGATLPDFEEEHESEEEGQIEQAPTQLTIDNASNSSAVEMQPVEAIQASQPEVEQQNQSSYGENSDSRSSDSEHQEGESSQSSDESSGDHK